MPDGSERLLEEAGPPGVFNLFNHEIYGSYVPAEVSPSFSRPVQNVAVEYQPRMMQLGFRVVF